MRPSPAWPWLLVCLSLLAWPASLRASDVLILARDVPIRQTPQVTGKVIKTARPGEMYEVPGRRPGRSQPLYVLDENGDLWVKIRVSDEQSGFVSTERVSVAREEYRSPRGNPLLIVNLRPTGDSGAARDLWVVDEGWQHTRRLAAIDGRPLWANHGEWFICQVDSGRPVKDPVIDRTVERIERFSADGRVRTMLAAGTHPVLHEARGEVYFYRDVDDLGDPVPPGLFVASVDGGHVRPVYLLPERYKFWKEDGDFFVEAPPPVVHAGQGRIWFYAFEPLGTRVRFTVSPDGQFLELRRD